MTATMPERVRAARRFACRAFRALMCTQLITVRAAGRLAVDRYARWNALLELLTESGRVSVEDAAERLDVSQATIRRDFDQLAQQQMITRTRGGAVANGVSYDLPLRYKTAKHSAEKQRIGDGRRRAGRARHGGRPQRRHHDHRGRPGARRTPRPERQRRRRPAHRGHQRAEHRQRAARPVPDEDRGGRRRGPPAVLRAGRPAGRRRCCARSPSTSRCSAWTPSTSSSAPPPTTRARRR